MAIVAPVVSFGYAVLQVAASIAQHAAGTQGVIPVVTDPYADLIHRVLSGVVVGLIVAVGGAFYRTNIMSAQHEVRFSGLEKRMSDLETDVKGIMPEMREITSELRAHIDRRADETNSQIREISEKVGFLRGQAEK